MDSKIEEKKKYSILFVISAYKDKGATLFQIFEKKPDYMTEDFGNFGDLVNAYLRDCLIEYADRSCQRYKLTKVGSSNLSKWMNQLEQNKLLDLLSLVPESEIKYRLGIIETLLGSILLFLLATSLNQQFGYIHAYAELAFSSAQVLFLLTTLISGLTLVTNLFISITKNWSSRLTNFIFKNRTLIVSGTIGLMAVIAFIMLPESRGSLIVGLVLLAIASYTKIKEWLERLTKK